jgi:excisionase family DNA binding protein
MENIYTVPEVASYLKMSNSKVYYLVQRKEIPHLRIGRNIRIRENDLKEWLEENAEPKQLIFSFDCPTDVLLKQK